MLFIVKNKLFPMQMLIGLLVLGSIWLQGPLNLTLYIIWEPQTLVESILGIAAIFASDWILQGVCYLTLGSAYLMRYRALVEFFRPQKVPEIIVAAILAGAEEVVFRGLILESLLRLAPEQSPWIAITITGILFGLAHLIPSRTLWPFALWAIWEGVLLGAIYVLSGSLLVCMIVHFVHDLAGFSFFAYQRKTGFLLGK